MDFSILGLYFGTYYSKEFLVWKMFKIKKNMAECVDCHLQTSYHAPQEMQLVATAREHVVFYQATHSTPRICFSMDCERCSKPVCSDCLYIDNWSLDIPVCSTCRTKAIRSSGYTRATRCFFTKEQRKIVWTMLLIRLRWKRECHPLAVLPNLFWLQNFSKCLV